MRDTRTRANLSVLAAMLGCITGTASASLIAENETYSTSGTIGTSGIMGTPIVNFQGVENGSLTTGTPFSLGQFTLDATQSGGTTAYHNTPFSIQFEVHGNGGQSPQTNETPITLTGALNGTISNSGQSDLNLNIILPIIPEFEPPAPFISTSFNTGTVLNTLKFDNWGAFALFQNPNENGTTTIQAQLDVTPVPVPEPSTLIVFGILLASAGLSRKRKAILFYLFRQSAGAAYATRCN